MTARARALPVTLRLPYPPSSNRYWATRVVKAKATGRPMAITYVTKEAEEFKAAVGLIARANGVRKATGLFVVTITLHPIEPKDAAARARRLGHLWHLDVRCIDRDNSLKVTLDALEGVAYDNDNQVLSIGGVHRGVPVPGGALVVTIEPADLDRAFPPTQAALALPEPHIHTPAEAA